MSNTDSNKQVLGQGPIIVEGKKAENVRIKGDSNFLRGTIADDLNDRMTGGFTADNFQLIRFHTRRKLQDK